MEKDSWRKFLRSWGVLIILSIIWGTSYILIKKSLLVFSPHQVACLRLTISALAFLPVLGFQWNRINWKKWPYLLLVGLTGTAIPSFLFPIAQTEVSSSVAGILNSLTPLFTLVLGLIFYGSSLVWGKVLGVVIGLIGAIFLVFFGEANAYQSNIWFSVLIVLATICYATSSNTVGYYLKDMNALLISTASFVMVGIPGLILLLQTNFIEVMISHEQSWYALGYVGFLALFSTVLASVVFFQLIKWTSPVFATMVSYLVPIVAVIWGIWDGEIITLFHMVGMGLILVGVYLSRQSD